MWEKFAPDAQVTWYGARAWLFCYRTRCHVIP